MSNTLVGFIVLAVIGVILWRLASLRILDRRMRRLAEKNNRKWVKDARRRKQ